MTDGSDLTVDFGDDTPPESFELAVPVNLKEVMKDEGTPPLHGRSRTDSPAGVKRSTRSRGDQPVGRTLPHSIEAEEYLLSCCLLDGADVVSRCLEAKIKPESFYDPKHGVIFECVLDLFDRKEPIEVSVVAEELKKSRQLDQVGGYAFLAQVSSRVPTIAQAGYFIDRVRQMAQLRSIITSATRAVENCYSFGGGDIAEIAQPLLENIRSIAPSGVRLTSRGLFDFTLPPAGDSSILVGNRYLSRGDGAILSSTSGMGKSSLTIQMATCWALGRPFHGGLQPNGPLRSLIFQSEDSDGDVAEVQLSVARGYELTAEECKEVNERVRIVSDRVHRGGSFVQELRRQIDLHKPDIVWINPLLAFIGGDVNDAEAAGQFLREGLNSTNEPARHAFVIVHHTAKPPKEAKDRKWNEVMYDMAGSADLTNWARAIMSLRARDAEGEFDLVLAKRGRRAGFTCASPSGAQRIPTTTVNLKHSRGRVQTPHGTEIPMIFWERFEGDAETQPDRGGRPSKHDIQEMLKFFPKFDEPFEEAAQIYRRINTIFTIAAPSFKDLCLQAEKEGYLSRGQTRSGGYGYRVSS